MLPVSIQVKNKQVVIVGGGLVAARRTQTLLQQEARVTVISPALHPALEALYQNAAFTWKNRTFHENDVEGAFIVVAATDSRAVNGHVGLCCGPHQLVNIADDPKKSTFHFPATLQKGLLTVAVTTDGASPTLSKKIRDQIDRQYNDAFIHYISFVKKARKEIIHSKHDANTKQQLLEELHAKDDFSATEQALFLDKCKYVVVK